MGLEAHGPGFKGQLFGVDLFGSNTVANNGVDYTGMMFAPMAIAMATASVSPIIGSTIPTPAAQVTVEVERDASNGSSIVVGSILAGVCEVDDAKGVAILSDY